MIRKRTSTAMPLMVGLGLCFTTLAEAQVGIDPNWGTNARTFALNCISADCGGGGVSGGDSGPGNLDDNVQGNPATSTVLSSLGNTTVTASFQDAGGGVNSMLFTGDSTSATQGISNGTAEALGLYEYSGPGMDLTITITNAANASYVGPTSGEDNNIDGMYGRVLLFVDDFSIEELGFEIGANLTCLGECYSPDFFLSTALDSTATQMTDSVTITLEDGDLFYMHGRMILGAAGGGTANAGDGIEITFSSTAGLTSVPGGSAPVDTDLDGVADDVDNCTEVANADQRDTNGDGYGNICDPDLNNDGTVNFLDIAMWSNFFNMPNTGDEDFNGDGFANFLDFAIIPGYFLGPPGPSGVAP